MYSFFRHRSLYECASARNRAERRLRRGDARGDDRVLRRGLPRLTAPVRVGSRSVAGCGRVRTPPRRTCRLRGVTRKPGRRGRRRGACRPAHRRSPRGAGRGGASVFYILGQFDFIFLGYLAFHSWETLGLSGRCEFASAKKSSGASPSARKRARRWSSSSPRPTSPDRTRSRRLARRARPTGARGAFGAGCVFP